MKRKTAQKILCNEEFAAEVAKNRCVGIQSLRHAASNLLNKLRRKENRRKKGESRI